MADLIALYIVTSVHAGPGHCDCVCLFHVMGGGQDVNCDFLWRMADNLQLELGGPP